MAKRLHPLLGSHEKDMVPYDGYVTLNASGAVVSSDILGASVAKTGTGEYTVTISDPKGSVRWADATFVCSSNLDLVAKVKSFTTSAVVFALCTGATPTDPTAGCGFFVAIDYKRSTARG